MRRTRVRFARTDSQAHHGCDEEPVATADPRRNQHVTARGYRRGERRRERASLETVPREKPFHYFRRFAWIGRAYGVDERPTRAHAASHPVEQRMLRRRQAF